MEEAKSSMPALLVLDNIAILCPSSAQDSPEAIQDASGGALVSWLSDLLSSLRPAGQMPLPGTPGSRPLHGIACMGPTNPAAVLCCLPSAGHMQVCRCPPHRLAQVFHAETRCELSSTVSQPFGPSLSFSDTASCFLQHFWSSA